MIGINFNPAINTGCRNKIKPNQGFVSNVFKFKNEPKNDVFEKSQISFKGSYDKNEEISQRVEKLINGFNDFPLTQVNGYPVEYVDKNWFLNKKITDLLKTEDPIDEEVAHKVLNILHLYKTKDDGRYNVTFEYDYSNNKDCLRAFRENSKDDRKYDSAMSENWNKKIIEAKLDDIQFAKEREDKNEKVRAQLRPIVEKLATNPKYEEVSIPNCIMLLSDDYVTAHDTGNWLKNVCENNHVEIFSGYNMTPDDAQDKLLDLLEQAQEKYQEDEKRTVIFAMHMDDLINVNKNSPQNIAQMKSIMQDANEAYNTTLVFWSSPQRAKELDEGAMQQSRVELIVED